MKQGQTAAGAAEIELLGRLTGFNTVSSRSNLEMIEFIKTYLAVLGVESVVLPDETGKKASLLATIGPADKAGYVLSGHTDVVPVDGQAWSRDPFTMWRDGGKLYGRGGTVTLSLNGRCRTADRDQKVMRKGLHLSRCSKRSTLRLVHDAFHLRTVDPGDDETGWRSDRGWREISEHAALF